MATIGDFVHYLSFNLKPTAAQKGIQMFARWDDKGSCEPNRSDVVSVQPFSLKWHRLLLFVLEVILGRLKIIVQEQLPRIIKSSSKSAESSDDGTVAAAAPVVDSSRMQIRKLTCPEAPSEGHSTSDHSADRFQGGAAVEALEEEMIYFDLKPNAQNFAVVECQVMVNAVLGCCRTVVWILQKYRTDIGSAADQSEVDLKVLRQKEIELLILILKNGLVSLEFSRSRQPPFTSRPPPSEFRKRRNIFLNNFLQFFRISICLRTLFFTNRSISSLVMSVLLNYLVEHIEVLADATLYHPLRADADPKANVHARLFQLCLGAVGTSNANDSVFKLHLTKLVNATTSLARQSENPANALTVLRHVIRTVCDHQIFALDIANLVLSLLKVLKEMHHFAVRPDVKDALLDLCLSMPAQLSTARPYLNLFMEPIALALHHNATFQMQVI
uniref:Uncharacterized protein n=1 Tax=Trichuris muris TaxID=70415 RepID=A0A5S6Q687_TRIMR